MWLQTCSKRTSIPCHSDAALFTHQIVYCGEMKSSAAEANILDVGGHFWSKGKLINNYYCDWSKISIIVQHSLTDDMSGYWNRCFFTNHIKSQPRTVPQCVKIMFRTLSVSRRWTLGITRMDCPQKAPWWNKSFDNLSRGNKQTHSHSLPPSLSSLANCYVFVCVSVCVVSAIL